MLTDMPVVKLLSTLLLLAALHDLAAAQTVPMPQPRPAVDAMSQSQPQQAATPDKPVPPPSACRLRLTDDLALAPSLPSIEGPGECGADDVVRLEAVVLANKSRVAITPPAVLRCSLAEAIIHWVREDVAPAAHSLEAALKSIDNYASYDCRGRNRIVGAKLSEHGKANALDIRSFKLANGTVVELTDPQVSRDFRERLRKITCARFMTVLGPGSDGYHENHIHVDLAERKNAHRMCHWEVRDPDAANTAGDANVPLPRPRPGGGHGLVVRTRSPRRMD
jgi:hypothetical protein